MMNLIKNRDFILFSIIIFGVILVGIANPYFVKPSSLSDVLTDTSILIILALSQMIVILIRAIDLSVASNLALSGMLISLLSTVYPELPVVFFIILSCLIGTFLGVLNGVSIAILKVPFIVTTLGTLSIYRGLIYFVSDGKQVYSHEFSESFLALIHYKFLSLSFLFWVAVFVFVVMYILLNHTRFGRNLYSLGGNPDAAKYIGINENKYVILAYSISGFFAGLCGYLWVARYSVASTQIAIGFELTVISAFRIEYWELEEAKLKRMPPEKELAGKVALITGAAGGIGSATALKFLQEGCCVVLTDIDKKSLQQTHAKFAARFGEDVVTSIKMDVTNENDVKHAVNQSIELFGGIDVLVANAGFASAALFENTSSKLWDKNMEVLSKGCFLISREVYQTMINQNKGGSIIFISSKNSLNASKGASAYSVAKSSLLHLSRSIALEGASFKIRSNVVNPDAVIQNSKIWSGDWKKQRADGNKIPIAKIEDFYKNRSLLKVSILPEDIAEGVYFFASSKSIKSTGNILNVDGGNITSFTR